MMNWEPRLLTTDELRAYLPAAHNAQDHSFALSDLVAALETQQHTTWPQLATALQDLAQVKTQGWLVKGAQTKTQFNPRRLISTAAQVDAAAIQARPCFLCPDNLPAEERGVAFGDDYVILCNPFPVLPRHLVIAHREHRPQMIQPHFEALLDVTAALGGDFFTLYNGARCGASAPDHLHFQACDVQSLPVLIDKGEWLKKNVDPLTDTAELRVRRGKHNVVFAEGNDREALSAWFAHAYASLQAVMQTEEEPLLNLIAACDDGYWDLHVLPRRKHRPAAYFAEGREQLLVSPAALDLSGVVVVPHADHFKRLKAHQLEQIFAEVLLDDETFAAWCERLSEFSVS